MHKTSTLVIDAQPQLASETCASETCASASPVPPRSFHRRPDYSAAVPEPIVRDAVLPGVDGDLRGTLFTPASGRRSPGVVVLPEVDGFSDDTVVSARRVADAGYHVLALDLYAPLGGTPPLRSSADTLAWSAQLDDHRQLSDLSLALEWFADVDGVAASPMGLLGFSLGGRYSLLLATEPRPIGAVVTFYSRPWPSTALGGVVLVPGDRVEQVRAPICAIFGDEDGIIPAKMVEEYRVRLLATQGNELHVVPGDHLFTNPSRRRRFRPESADRAWATALSFLDRHLH